MTLDRRIFIRTCSALAGFRAEQTASKVKARERPRPLRAAFHAGADGVVLSREYVEMWLANLSAASKTQSGIFARRTA
jgi:hypothetical protein